MKSLVFFFSFCLSFFASTPSFADTPVSAEPYGQYIVNQAWENLESEVMPWSWYALGDPKPLTDKEGNHIAAQINQVYLKAYAARVIGFRPGSDPIFKLHDGQPARAAVTGDSPESPIYFNLDVIGNPELFSYSKAVGLIVHELGHKIQRQIKTDFGTVTISQSEIDVVAGKLEGFAALRESRVVFEDAKGTLRELHVFNLCDDRRAMGGRPEWFEKKPLVGVILEGSKILPLNSLLFGEIDRINLDKKDWRIYRSIRTEMIRAESDSKTGMTKFHIAFKHRLDRKNVDINHQDPKYYAETSFLQLDLDSDSPVAKRVKSAVSTSARYSVIPKLVLNSRVEDGKRVTVTGYVDFRPWLGSGKAYKEDLAVVFEVDGVRKTEPMNIVAGEEIWGEFKIVTATFVHTFDFNPKSGIDFEFIAVQARIPVNLSNGANDLFYVPPREVHRVRVMP
ncbi:MAG: hypothetical protein V4692_07585 [Bdellovibrionota bacterium]